MSTALDLDETRRLKEAIEKNPDNYKQILEDTFLASCVTDVNGDINYINQNYTKYAGYKKEDAIGRHFKMLVPIEQQEKLEELHDRFFERQFQMLRYWQTKHINGHQVNIQADAQYMELSDGQPYKVMFIHPED